MGHNAGEVLQSSHFSLDAWRVGQRRLQRFVFAGVPGTPLDLAPTPDALLCPVFDSDVIQAHLDALEQDQQDDGGWPINWDPPSPAAAPEWRAWKTLEALRRLRAYGRA